MSSLQPEHCGQKFANVTLKCILLTMFVSRFHWGVFERSNWQWITIVWDNGLAQHKQQTFTYINDNAVHGCTYDMCDRALMGMVLTPINNTHLIKEDPHEN